MNFKRYFTLFRKFCLCLFIIITSSLYPSFSNFIRSIQPAKPILLNVEYKCSTNDAGFPSQNENSKSKYVPQITNTISGDTLTVYSACSAIERKIHQIKFPAELIQEGQEKPLTIA